MTRSDKYQIIIADDHPFYLGGLKNALQLAFISTYIECADNYLSIFTLLQDNEEEIDLLIMDLNMPGATGYSGLYYLRSKFPELPILVISSQDTLEVKEKCIDFGASCFLSKTIDIEELISSVDLLLSGKYFFSKQTFGNASDDRGVGNLEKISKLTKSQFKVLHLITSGLSNKEIAKKLNITEKTVKNHCSAIYIKLGVHNRTQASYFLVQHGVN